MTNLFSGLAWSLFIFSGTANAQPTPSVKEVPKLVAAAAAPKIAPPNLSQIRTLVTEKKVDEAVKLLKLHHKAVLKTTADKEQLSRWLSIFMFDDTMSIFEKAVGMMDAKPDEAELEFKKALAAEPYNKELVQHYASFLLGQGRAKEAKEFLDHQLAEQPYMKIYEVYNTHAKGLLGEIPKDPMCEEKSWSETEQHYCYLVQLILKVLVKEDVITTKNTLEPGVLKNLLKKIKMPDGYYWAWRGRGDKEDLKKYVSLCQSLSDKDKKLYKIVPGACTKTEEAAQQLKAVALWNPDFKYSLVNGPSPERQ